MYEQTAFKISSVCRQAGTTRFMSANPKFLKRAVFATYLDQAVERQLGLIVDVDLHRLQEIE
jgi:hypothetical protein